jgi:DNA-binding NarL/FixJ family response regulator
VPPLRILVVEDHELFRQCICTTLAQRFEFSVVGEVSNGLESVQKAQELQPDVILLDIGLPGMSGLEVARRVRQSCSHSRILFLSSLRDEDVIREALRLGALGYVEKKRLDMDLLNAMDAICQGRQFVSSGLLTPNHDVPTDSPRVNPHPQEAFSTLSLPGRELARRHEVQFFPDDATLLEGLVPFLTDALREGNCVIVVATEPHRKAIRHHLQARNLDWAAVTRSEQYVSLDAEQALSAFMDDSEPNWERFCAFFAPLFSHAKTMAESKQKRVMAFGEMVALLCAQGRPGAALRLEWMWNELLKTHNFLLRCGYPLTCNLDKGLYAQICAEHDAVVAPSSM